MAMWSLHSTQSGKLHPGFSAGSEEDLAWPGPLVFQEKLGHWEFM